MTSPPPLFSFDRLRPPLPLSFVLLRPASASAFSIVCLPPPPLLFRLSTFLLLLLLGSSPQLSAISYPEVLDPEQAVKGLSGLWPSSTEGKLLFDPVISFMGQTNEGSSVDSSQKAESSEHPPKVDKSSGESESPQKLSTVEAKEGVKTETSQHSSTEQMADKEETEVVKEETDDKHAATVEETETVVAEPEKSESESSSLPVEPFEPTVKNDGPSESVGSQDDNKISVVGPSVNPETMQGKSRAVEVDQVEEGHTVLPREAHDVDVDEQKTQVEQKDGHMTQAGEIVETVAMVEAETPTDSQPGDNLLLLDIATREENRTTWKMCKKGELTHTTKNKLMKLRSN
ncbi:golgin candidate 5 [Prunus dulcis]|uniref:Golgin candidate 5 n=1 Tax=Prunus dulcis TaxID=3755 RepID=A0A4Y1QRC1_PRUDU|nr:golgin candidate 5 [Prunus dulcis]